MRKLFPCLAVLGLLSVPLAGRADTFNFTLSGSAGGFSGSGTFTATQMGSYYQVTAITGPSAGITGLIPVGGYNGNDNKLYPTSNPFVDGSGIGFTDLMGNTSFKVDLFSTGANQYFINFVDNDGFSPPSPLPVTFSVTPATTPEPSSLVLLGTGALGLAGAARRRFRKA